MIDKVVLLGALVSIGWTTTGGRRASEGRRSEATAARACNPELQAVNAAQAEKVIADCGGELDPLRGHFSDERWCSDATNPAIQDGDCAVLITPARGRRSWAAKANSAGTVKAYGSKGRLIARLRNTGTLVDNGSHLKGGDEVWLFATSNPKGTGFQLIAYNRTTKSLNPNATLTICAQNGAHTPPRANMEGAFLLCTPAGFRRDTLKLRPFQVETPPWIACGPDCCQVGDL